VGINEELLDLSWSIYYVYLARYTAGSATHIITSQQLSGSKTHKILTTKTKVQVVRPEWVTDSIASGKRKPEREYAVIQAAGSQGMQDFLHM